MIPNDGLAAERIKNQTTAAAAEAKAVRSILFFELAVPSVKQKHSHGKAITSETAFSFVKRAKSDDRKINMTLDFFPVWANEAVEQKERSTAIASIESFLPGIHAAPDIVSGETRNSKARNVLIFLGAISLRKIKSRNAVKI